jgi:hypothetical protein
MGERRATLSHQLCDDSHAVVAVRERDHGQRSHAIHGCRDLIDQADFVHQDEPNRCKTDQPSEAQPVLQGAFAKRTIAWLDSKQLLPGNGGCDDAT